MTADHSYRGSNQVAAHFQVEHRRLDADLPNQTLPEKILNTSVHLM